MPARSRRSLRKTIHRSSGWLALYGECVPTHNDEVEVAHIMGALEPEVMDVIWAAVEALLPAPPPHPLGCHRPRVPDRLCLRGILIRLVTGSSWVDIKAILDHAVSDTTLRARRDEWIKAGAFTAAKNEKNLGLRWVVEATNTWPSNYGQLRHNTDRKSIHRHAALCLATVVLIVGRLLNWRDRWTLT